MARQEKYTKPGAKPQVQPATIHEDLRGRDFTVNAIALSLSKASRGLLLDPTNGLADLEHKELRAVSNYTLYDDPSRILRLIRLRVRLGFQVAERTQSQYQNVREAQLETKISIAHLEHELRQIGLEPLAGEILKAFEEERLLPLISPALAGPKLNLPGFQKLHKAKQLLPFDIDLGVNQFALFLNVFLEKLTPKERASLVKAIGFSKDDLDSVAKMEAKAKKLEKELTGARLQRPSALYGLLSKMPGELIVYLLLRSNQRIVVDRLKNYLQKYLPAAREITEVEIAEHVESRVTSTVRCCVSSLTAAKLMPGPVLRCRCSCRRHRRYRAGQDAAVCRSTVSIPRAFAEVLATVLNLGRREIADDGVLAN